MCANLRRSGYLRLVLLAGTNSSDFKDLMYLAAINFRDFEKYTQE